MLPVSTINNIEIAISPQILWIEFGVVSLIVAIISIVLLYHWASYGYKPIKTGFMGTVYFIGILIFLGVIFFSLVSYTASI